MFLYSALFDRLKGVSLRLIAPHHFGCAPRFIEAVKMFGVDKSNVAVKSGSALKG